MQVWKRLIGAKNDTNEKEIACTNQGALTVEPCGADPEGYPSNREEFRRAQTVREVLKERHWV